MVQNAGLQKIPIDRLKLLAYQRQKQIFENGEQDRYSVLETELTPLIYDWIYDCLKRGELVRIRISGLMRRGKSTVAAHLFHTGNRCIEELKGKSIKDLHFIAADAIEKTRIFQRADCEDVFVWQDEVDVLGDSGYNATVEMKMAQHDDEVGAAFHRHLIECCPRDDLTSIASLHLETLSIDTQAKTITCAVQYLDIARSMNNGLIPLGRATFHVKTTLELPMYKKYVEKKMQKLNLLRDHGVADVRTLEHAALVMAVFEELEPIAKLTGPNVAHSFVTATMRRKLREGKLLYSILAENNLSLPIQDLLNCVSEIGKIKEQRDKAQLLANASEAAKKLAYLRKCEELEKKIILLNAQHEHSIADYKHLCEIHAKYRAITIDDEAQT